MHQKADNGSAPNANAEALTRFHWAPQPQAAAFVQKVVDDFLGKLPEAAAFAERLYRETGNRFGDLIDFMAFGDRRKFDDACQIGWNVVDDVPVAEPFTVARNTDGRFPLVGYNAKAATGEVLIDLKVESVADFLTANGLSLAIDGEAGSMHRWSMVASNDELTWGVIERHGFAGVGKASEGPSLAAQAKVLESFRTRRRGFVEESVAFDVTEQLLDKAISAVGRDLTCDLFFAAEREYWQRRNKAAQFQKARQDKLGIGWANHDHHTYRSSRRHFARLVGLWEKLGFACRERFYPGPEAGWGAQVMEQPVCGIVTFNDVDISPDELLMDFAHEPMEDHDDLATVGLWCALHGESLLQAGMHHLECTFDFDALEQQMAQEGGIKTMRKFTDFPHLKQAFTEGERWAADPARIDRLLKTGRITAKQANQFRTHGAIGSHLENLERNDGFKGFNQTGVTDIIKATDPRLLSSAR